MTGKRPFVFSRSMALNVDEPRELPCGQCIGCLLERSRQWAVRMMHEVKSGDDSAFLTLTYSPKNLPPDGSLVVRDVQLFMKRLRKRRPPGVRFYACGEYGDGAGRPHYHVVLFNTNFPDRRFLKKSGSGESLFFSRELSDIWPVGNSAIGAVTFESCAYVARYCTKVVRGDAGAMYYAGAGIAREFSLQSNGIGEEWMRRFRGEFYQHDSCILNGKEVSLPRYYDLKFAAIDEQHLIRLKARRRARALKRAEDNTPERRRVREVFELLKQRRFDRRLS